MYPSKTVHSILRCKALAVLAVAALFGLPALIVLAAPHVFGDGLRRMPRSGEILPGRITPMPLPMHHAVFHTPLDVIPPGMETAMFGMGCFWGAEQYFLRVQGVVSTAVGYSG